MNVERPGILGSKDNERKPSSGADAVETGFIAFLCEL